MCFVLPSSCRLSSKFVLDEEKQQKMCTSSSSLRTPLLVGPSALLVGGPPLIVVVAHFLIFLSKTKFYEIRHELEKGEGASSCWHRKPFPRRDLLHVIPTWRQDVITVRVDKGKKPLNRAVFVFQLKLRLVYLSKLFHNLDKNTRTLVFGIYMFYMKLFHSY